MANDLWQKIDEIFPLVADLPADERTARLVELCEGDDDLRLEITAMLAFEEKAAGFIETPVIMPSSLSDAFSGGERMNGDNPYTLEFAGRQIGAYRVVRKLGSGGMGAVYLAERADGEFRKQAAIKLVKRGADTAFNLLRFRHERQILASLEHPNIARLLDGGTTDDGSPFFVMEYVEGKPLFEYCAAENSDLRGRLQLFRQILAAVAYAHERGVVHRDIKPGNILVARDGSVRLLDFGIAKILDPDLIPDSVGQTETLLRQMTPEYASPEQICGEEITAASDVYSLGVVLYELLTGERPYKFTSRAPHEIARVICEESPSSFVLRPSPEIYQTKDEGQRTKDDLNFIVLKSLQKKSSERYTSVNDFDRDIAALLDGLPVEKTRTTDDFAVPSATANIKLPGKFKTRTAMAGVAALIFLALVVAAANFGTGVFQNTDTPSDSAAAIPQTVERAESKMPLSADAVANELYQAGKQQLAARTPDDINRAIEFFSEAAERDPNFAAAFSGLADAHILLAFSGLADGNILQNGRNGKSAAAYRQAEEYAVKALALEPDLAEARTSLAMARFVNTGDLAAAEKHFLRAIEINPQLATAHHWYALILNQSRRPDDALREMEIAARLEPASAAIQSGLANLLLQAKRYDEAIIYYDRAIAVDNTFVAAYYWKSLVEQFQGKYDAALDTYRKARIYSGDDENEPLWILMNAQAHAVAGRRDESLAVLNRYFQGAEHRKNPTALAHEVALVYNLLGDGEKTFEWLKKIEIVDATQAKFNAEDPRFSNLQSDPRYVELTKKWINDGNAKSRT